MRLFALLSFHFLVLACGRRNTDIIAEKDSSMADEIATQSVKKDMTSKLKTSHPKELHSLAWLILASPAAGHNAGGLIRPSRHVRSEPRMLEVVRGPMPVWLQSEDSRTTQKIKIDDNLIRRLDSEEDNLLDGFVNWTKNLVPQEDSHAKQNNGPKRNWAKALTNRGSGRSMATDSGNYHAMQQSKYTGNFESKPSWAKSLTTQGSGRILATDSGNSPSMQQIGFTGNFEGKPSWAKSLTTQNSGRLLQTDTFGGSMTSHAVQKTGSPRNSEGKSGKRNWAKTLRNLGSDRIPENRNDHPSDGLMTRPISLPSQDSHAMQKNEHSNNFDGKRNWAKALTAQASDLLANAAGNRPDGLTERPKSFALGLPPAMKTDENADYSGGRRSWAKILKTHGKDRILETRDTDPFDDSLAVQTSEIAHNFDGEPDASQTLATQDSDRTLETDSDNSVDELMSSQDSPVETKTRVSTPVMHSGINSRRPHWAKFLTR